MDPLAQLSQKVIPEQTTQFLHQQLHQQQPTPDSAPPPYMPSEHDDYEDDSEDEDNEPNDQHPPQSPLKLTLNAAHNIQGSNNLVPTSPSPLADATRFTTLLLAAVKQLNAAATSDPLSSSSSRIFPAAKRAPPLTVELTINCGITIVGDRNVVGNVSLKPKAPAQAFAGPAAAHPTTSTATTSVAGAAAGDTTDHAVAGAKRKADHDDEVSGEGRFAKKVALG
ncbi:hypothetical protein D0869_04701 [Hortaea werneckii]|uniref:Uncharacterized protein n=1 Tax=Hortaea werneckii TaxID=91943 RepID=A0A3M6XPQ3_HORWE|nr:hypothetical protein D0869_04701 [Hortaea werneckii]RMX92430.1 hypothetical protein D0868_13413 [Hortaea werneckii]RMY13558.1 hypothetical protein D0867_07412 [Hortaea werneckii]RMY30806.1 hypothetical protein D0866_07739 [Hortaea werneckii]